MLSLRFRRGGAPGLGSPLHGCLLQGLLLCKPLLVSLLLDHPLLGDLLRRPALGPHCALGKNQASHQSQDDTQPQGWPALNVPLPTY